VNEIEIKATERSLAGSNSTGKHGCIDDVDFTAIVTQAYSCIKASSTIHKSLPVHHETKTKNKIKQETKIKKQPFALIIRTVLIFSCLKAWTGINRRLTP
jgi:hypothetical protein